MYATFAPSSSSSSVSHPRLPLCSSSRRRAAPVKAVSTLAAESATAGKINSLYEILRVKRTASLNEIKTAYRSLAKLYHPDAVIRQRVDDESDGKDFIQIHNAYETLSDPEARATYDLRLAVAIGSGWSRRMSSSSGYYPTRRWETDQCW